MIRRPGSLRSSRVSLPLCKGSVRFWRASAGTYVAPICCVMPPASPSCTLVRRTLSSNFVLPGAVHHGALGRQRQHWSHRSNTCHAALLGARPGWEAAWRETCIDVAEDAADGGAEIVLRAGLERGLEAGLPHLALPRQALLPLLLAVHLRAALLLR
jgi:hypothetical protein